MATSFRLALGSFTEDMRNRISVIGLVDERALWEDELEAPMTFNQPQNGLAANSSQDFVCLAEATHGYPPTKIAWQPASAQKMNNYGESGLPRELLATTADGLRIWEYTQVPEADRMSTQFSKSTFSPMSGRLHQRVMLTGVSNSN